MSDKVKVLLFVSHYLPGYKSGGPVRTIENLVNRLGDEIEFRIVCSDHDLGETTPYDNVLLGQWNDFGAVKVYYAAPKDLSLIGLRRVFSSVSFDMVYLNSFFDVKFTIYPLLLRSFRMIKNKPFAIAPRGEFSSGALAIKWQKKRLFIKLAYFFGIYNGLTWQASSQFEHDDIRRSLPFVPDNAIKVALDLSPSHEDESFLLQRSLRFKSPESLRVCFLSRLSPKKNLDYALKCMASVRENVIFTIYGPKEDLEYWGKCEVLINQLPANVTVQYCGAVEHGDVQSALVSHDLFFLPTRGENYGHVIHEALSAGLPVLISDQTPWQDLDRMGVGWAISLSDSNEFASIIDQIALMPADKLMIMRQAAMAYARDKSVDISVLQANRDLFFDVVAGA